MGCSPQVKMHLETDKYKNHDELIAAIRAAGVESMRCVLFLDFSASNKRSGLHHPGGLVPTPYQKVIQILEPVLKQFDDQKVVYAYRFGCIDTQDHSVCPLFGANAECDGFENLDHAYRDACDTVEMSGPTTFTHCIAKCIEIEKQLGGKQLIVCVIVTDGTVTDEEEDIKQLYNASKYPISFVGIGVGPGPFGILEKFDDQLRSKFDNFQFMNEVDQVAETANNPQVVLSTAVFNELPEQFKAMKKKKYL
ncbi:Copine_I [Hexamita inflata]|uniref:Copine I n=1 Tax=Hexamita inflata TaxID=28002 RepID=A0AA86R118_9EUKA|nr:Copine I [Hexamita inflata]